MRAPQAEANCRARSGVTHSSSLLITTAALNGNRSSGMGTKPSVPGGYFGDSTSLGATRSAPLILANSEGVACLARWATAAQPRLCAASTTGPGALRTAARMRSIQSALLGVSQFSCSTRRVCLRSRSQYVCQWSGPLLHSPGMVSSVITNLCLGFGGQGEAKSCAARRVACCPQASAMRFDDGGADAKSHAGAVRLGGEECIEDLVGVLLRNPHAGVADGHQGLLVLSALRGDDELPGPVDILHRLDAVHQEVHQHLLQLHAISQDPGNARRQLGPDGDRVSRRLAAQEGNRLSNDFVDIDQFPLRSPLLEEHPDPTEDPR